MKNFFEFLDTQSLSPTRMRKTIENWSISEIGDFMHKCEEIIPYYKDVPDEPTLFDFAASGALSGHPFPCANIECRLKKADQLARFAALYGNRVVIINPMPRFPPEKLTDEIKEKVVENLRLLYHYKPLLEANIISLTPHSLAFCAEHAREIIALEKQLEQATRAILRKYASKIKIDFEEHGDFTVINYSGPEILFEHKSSHKVIRGDASEWKRKKKTTLLVDHVSPVMEDVLRQNATAIQHCTNYLTNHELHIELVRSINNNEVNRYSDALVKGFSHSLPFLNNVSLNKLVLLRQKETEAFNVYRDAVAAVLKSVSPLDAKHFREAFNDQVLPELNKIDLSIKNSRRSIFRSLASDFVVSSAYISIGLFGGIFPPDFGKILIALGGYKFATSISAKISQMITKPDSIRENKYYFLWKTRE